MFVQTGCVHIDTCACSICRYSSSHPVPYPSPSSSSTPTTATSTTCTSDAFEELIWSSCTRTHSLIDTHRPRHRPSTSTPTSSLLIRTQQAAHHAPFLQPRLSFPRLIVPQLPSPVSTSTAPLDADCTLALTPLSSVILSFSSHSPPQVYSRGGLHLSHLSALSPSSSGTASSSLAVESSLSVVHFPSFTDPLAVVTCWPSTLSQGASLPSLTLIDCERDAIVQRTALQGPVRLATKTPPVSASLTTASDDLVPDSDSGGFHATAVSSCGSLLAIGRSDGYIEMRDSRTLASTCGALLPAHAGAVTKMALNHSFLLASVGFTASSSIDTPSHERIVRVFDLRKSGSAASASACALPPLVPTLTHAPCWLEFLPFSTSLCVVVSEKGYWQKADVSSLMMDGRRVMCSTLLPAAHIITASLSHSAECLTLADNRGTLHQFTVQRQIMDEDNNEIVPVYAALNPISRPTEMVHALSNIPVTAEDEVLPCLSFDANTHLQTGESLGSVPLPFGMSGTEPNLLSSWANVTCRISMKELIRPPIDPNLIEGARWLDGIAYVPLKPDKNNTSPLTVEVLKDRWSRKTLPSSVLKSNLVPSDSSLANHVEYARPRIVIPRFGLSVADLSKYNLTHLTALDSFLPNSYCNPLLLMLYFIPLARQSFLSHLCEREICLHCELGFLFRMLDTARGAVAEPRNFLRALAALPSSSSLNLLDPMDTEWSTAVQSGKSKQEIQKESSKCILHRYWQPYVRSTVPRSSSIANKQSDHHALQHKVPGCYRFILEQLRKEEEVSSHDSQLNTTSNGSDGAGHHHQYREEVRNEAKVQSADFPLSSSTVRSNHELIQHLFGFPMMTTVSCMQGAHNSEQLSHHMFVALVYPIVQKDSFSTTSVSVDVSFEALLSMALQPKQSSRIWCTKCSAYRSITTQRSVKQLPLYLNIDSNVQDEHSLDIWRRHKVECEPGTLEYSSWLPSYIGIHTDTSGLLHVKAMSRAQAHETSVHSSSFAYALVSVVSVIASAPDKARGCLGHAVLHVKTNENYGVEDLQVQKKSLEASQMAKGEVDWFVFNDFVIRPSSEQEATRFDYPFKRPSVLLYMRLQNGCGEDVSRCHSLFSSLIVNPFLQTKFTYHKSLAMNSQLYSRTFTPLQEDEVINEKMRVAIDCEFVQVSPQMVGDFDPVTGEVPLLRPARMQLARVSVVRGNEGPLFAVPLMDDYIAVSDREYIQDYLTQYSGITMKDLNRSTSAKHLCTLKQTYCRLRCFIDRGVKFIGHGLESDFRICNLLLPPAQVIDTVVLYSLPNQRKLSLRLLAERILNTQIQNRAELGHDSIEDAQTALRLVEFYEKLEQQGPKRVHEFISSLFRSHKNNTKQK